MASPVAFISRYAVRPGMLEELKPVWRTAASAMDAAKPGTLVFVSFVDEPGTRMSIIHVFGDAEAMDRHIEGSGERARDAFRYIDPLGWEIYGRPSASAVETLQRAADAAGVGLVIYPEFLSGFLHPPR